MLPSRTSDETRQRVGVNSNPRPGEEWEAKREKGDTAPEDPSIAEGVSGHGTQRGIKSRQAQMLAIGGTIGA